MGTRVGWKILFIRKNYNLLVVRLIQNKRIKKKRYCLNNFNNFNAKFVFLLKCKLKLLKRTCYWIFYKINLKI